MGHLTPPAFVDPAFPVHRLRPDGAKPAAGGWPIPRRDHQSVQLLRRHKYQDAAQPYRAYTKAFKQRIYLAAQSPATDGAELDWIGSVLARHAIDARRCDSLLAAERFSITNYVHPALALADTTLKAIFQPQTPVQYLYKTYPEGPLCPEVIADMLELSEDYKRLLNHLGVEEINLLRF